MVSIEWRPPIFNGKKNHLYRFPSISSYSKNITECCHFFSYSNLKSFLLGFFCITRALWHRNGCRQQRTGIRTRNAIVCSLTPSIACLSSSPRRVKRFTESDSVKREPVGFLLTRTRIRQPMFCLHLQNVENQCRKIFNSSEQE